VIPSYETKQNDTKISQTQSSYCITPLRLTAFDGGIDRNPFAKLQKLSAKQNHNIGGA